MSACDGPCYRQHVHVKKLKMGGDNNAYLCRPCWAKEMIFRTESNLEVHNLFEIIFWEDAPELEENCHE